ncbi:TetR/AcrR family transcriptional regulator [Nitrospirillum iridis]|uniref:AcrR family transcriptional regulator n=1 Tax=Nitrospirillum iridis TaxID=765888 RepID=A0A7X0EEW7_9PROT|nr:TetR family transcriptional regulator [Nitrospirillum iridis]MBB6251879.1 AcrR family transcriptional regulator [Nitrospirillum iridis]
MDNATRSERTRAAVIKAALTIIARDGAGKLTLDAIARESGISKGGVMHQFKTKQAVLEALLEHQMVYSADVTRALLAKLGPDHPEAQLVAHIETLRDVVSNPHSVAFALLGAMAEDPQLLSTVRSETAPVVERIRAEAADPDLATLRWVAAQGLAVTTIFGLSPLGDEERARLFDLLADSRRWAAAGAGAKAF